MLEMSITIYGLEFILYEGKVRALTSVNNNGQFDILPLHSNFISLIKDKLILYERAGDKKELKLKSGVLKVINNKVSVFLGLEGLIS